MFSKAKLIDYFLCTITVFLLMFILGKLPLPNIDLMDPIGETLSDFQATDVMFSKIKKQKSGGLFAINEERADTNIVLVNIGECNRATMGEVLHIVNLNKPKVIGIDAFYKKPKSEELDYPLEKALEEAENLILVNKLVYNEEKDGFTDLITSNPRFIQHTDQAYANLPTEGENLYKTCRNFAPTELLNGKKVLSFPVALANYYSPELTKKFLDRNNELEEINYIGNTGVSGNNKFMSIDYQDILDSNYSESMFKNKIVLFGFLGRTLSDTLNMEDKFFSPLNDKYVGKSIPDMYGVVIHANIIHEILSEEYLNKMSVFFSILVSIFICFLSVIILYHYFIKYPLMYGTLSKLIVFAFIFVALFLNIFCSYSMSYLIDLNLGLIGIVLAADIVEIYAEIIKPKINHILYKIFKLKEFQIIDQH